MYETGWRPLDAESQGMSHWEGLRNACWVGLGGFLGANARYWLGLCLQDRLGRFTAWPTFWINTTGCFLIGLLFTLLADKHADAPRSPELRLLLGTGFLGAYTTFSAFEYETWTLLTHGRYGAAAANVVGSTVLGLLACVLGILLARAMP